MIRPTIQEMIDENPDPILVGEPRRLIFLDIDGVLNSKRWWASLEPVEVEFRWKTGAIFQPELVERFNQLVADTNAYIVVTSSHRFDAEWSELLERWAGFGLLTDRIIGRTARYFSVYDRGGEIGMWVNRLNTAPIESMAIIDDDDDMCHYGRYLVQTSWECGLTPDDVVAARALLETAYTGPDLRYGSYRV